VYAVCLCARANACVYVYEYLSTDVCMSQTERRTGAQTQGHTDSKRGAEESLSRGAEE